MTAQALGPRLSARIAGVRGRGRMLRLAPFDTTTSDGRSDERFRRASLSAAASAAAKAVALVTTAVSVPLTLGYLGTERFGVWMALSALIALLGFTDLGLGNSLLNSVAHAAGLDDRSLIRANLSNGLAMLVGVAAGLGVLLAIMFDQIPWASMFNVRSGLALDEVGPAAAVLVACFLVGMPTGAFQNVRLGLQQGYVNALFVGLGNLAGLALVIAAIQMRLGLPWLVLAMAGAPVLASLVNGLVLLARESWLRPTLSDLDRRLVRALLRVGSLFLVLQLAVAVAFTSNSLIIAALIGPAAVAEYAVVSKLFLIPVLLIGFALGPLWPAYREALSRGDLAWIRQTFGRSLRLALLVGGATSAALVVIGIPLVGLWVGGNAVTPSLGLVVAVGVWTTLSCVGMAVAMLLNGIEVMRFQVVVALAMATANVLLSIALTAALGVAGAVVGSIIVYPLVTLLPVALYVPRLFARLERERVAAGVA